MASRGTLTTLSIITCEAAFSPVLGPGGSGMRNSGASTRSEVTGQMLTLA
jgi:hypothetical protein